MEVIATDCNPKTSKPSAMPCKTYSLQALATCPGSIDLKTKEIVPACADCYACKNMYLMSNVKALRAHNLEDWKHGDWINCMVSIIGNDKLFRWFDSGDCYHVGLAEKIYQVMKLTPNCSHWLPTRMAKFKKFRPILAKMARLHNVVVRKSSDSVTGGRIRGKTTSTIIQDVSQLGNAHLCPKTKHGIPKKLANCKAQNCYVCWDKGTPVVAYIQH